MPPEVPQPNLHFLQQSNKETTKKQQRSKPAATAALPGDTHSLLGRTGTQHSVLTGDWCNLVEHTGTQRSVLTEVLRSLLERTPAHHSREIGAVFWSTQSSQRLVQSSRAHRHSAFSTHKRLVQPSRAHSARRINMHRPNSARRQAKLTQMEPTCAKRNTQESRANVWTTQDIRKGASVCKARVIGMEPMHAPSKT
eukprot:1156718-Pelagomonas_calceolata.AAC.7